MNTLIAMTLLFSSTITYATNVCLKNPKETVSRNIVRELPKLKEGDRYPSLPTSFEKLENHINKIQSATVLRGKTIDQDILIKIRFKDGSDAHFTFMAEDIGRKSMQNVLWTISTVSRNKSQKLELNETQLKSLFKTKTFSALGMSYDYIDQETEIGRKVPLKHCIIEFAARPRNEKYNELF